MPIVKPKELNQQSQTSINQLLNIVTQKLITDGYHTFKHKRLSVLDMSDSLSHNACLPTQAGIQQSTSYQGLTQAQHNKHADVMIDVMIKWQISWQMQLSNQTDAQTISNPLDIHHEIDILKQLQTQDKAISNRKNTQSVLLPLCIVDNQTIETSSQQTTKQQASKQQATKQEAANIKKISYLVLPFYPLGNVTDFLKTHAYLSSDYLSLLIALLLSISQSIATLHQLGWIHGDIKPSNILVTDCQYTQSNWQISVKLIDMSLASFGNTDINTSTKRVINPIINKAINDNNCTNHNHHIHNPTHHPIDRPSYQSSHTQGTAAYLAPECWQGQPKSIHSDMYAFGVMMLSLMTGGQTIMDIQHPISTFVNTPSTFLNTLPINLLRWTASASQRQMITKLLNTLVAPNPENRYQDMLEVSSQLQCISS